jgi:cyclopropane fatty-acyl-phospholipid synthase-like methyltransferase
MAHQAQRLYIEKVKKMFPRKFHKKRVVDFGSLDINGSNREFFTDCDYTGVDISEGKNVDVVSKCHEFESEELFDTIITTEMLEHDMYWDKSVQKMFDLLKSGGLLIITCATTGRAEHGTPRSDKGYSSPFTSSIPEWANYYRNLTEQDIESVLNCRENFSHYEHSVEHSHRDYQFYGLKK